jgi:glycosyltransferase involved in cell wall biosynthesis
LLRSHFHVLFPTAEAFGVVFAEANEHAVPNITWDVGGIASAVINDKGGRCFNPQHPISDIAAYIKPHVLDRDRYAVLARAARQEYEERLNWAVAGVAVKKELEAVVRRGVGEPNEKPGRACC